MFAGVASVSVAGELKWRVVEVICICVYIEGNKS